VSKTKDRSDTTHDTEKGEKGGCTMKEVDGRREAGTTRREDGGR
jgi:hypothetical protein